MFYKDQIPSCRDKIPAPVCMNTANHTLYLIPFFSQTPAKGQTGRTTFAVQQQYFLSGQMYLPFRFLIRYISGAPYMSGSVFLLCTKIYYRYVGPPRVEINHISRNRLQTVHTYPFFFFIINICGGSSERLPAVRIKKAAAGPQNLS